MAVYERAYKRYTGEITGRSTRFLILPRYLLKDVFASKLLTFFFAFCFAFPLFCAIYIVVVHNAALLEFFPNMREALKIDAGSIATFFDVQSILAFFLSMFVGPGLVSRDLANNGLSLYFSRPFLRSEYVLGKASVLALLISAITWVAGFGLVGMMVGFEGWTWLDQQRGALIGYLALCLLWILVLSLLALSVSAWVRWRPVAGFAMMAFLIAGPMFAAIINKLFRTEMGSYLNFFEMIHVLQVTWIGGQADLDITPTGAVISIAFFLAFFLYLLHRKIRAYEVVS